MEIDVGWEEHITAPVALVWDEIATLDQILAKTPQAFHYEVMAGGERATLQVHLAWGPVKWEVGAEMTLVSAQTCERLAYGIDVPTLDLDCAAAIDLSAVGSGNTKYVYHAHLECRHRLAGRMRGMLADLLEEHMYGLANRVKVRSEQRRLAQDRLLS